MIVIREFFLFANQVLVARVLGLHSYPTLFFFRRVDTECGFAIVHDGKIIVGFIVRHRPLEGLLLCKLRGFAGFYVIMDDLDEGVAVHSLVLVTEADCVSDFVYDCNMIKTVRIFQTDF